MKKLLILTRFPPEYEPQRLAKEAREEGVEPEIVNYEEIQVRPGMRLEDFDFVIPRSAAHFRKKSLLKLKIALIKALPEKTICLNKETYLRYPKLGKIRQAEILKEHHLSAIPTLKISTPEVSSPSRWCYARGSPGRCPAGLSFPAILKAEFGSHSRRVVKVENQKQANKVMQSYAGRWLYQPLIKSPVYWRVIVLGGRSLGVMERKTSKRFFEPVSTKVSTYVHPGGVNRELEDLAIKATKIFQAEFAGVDLLADKDKLMIIEVNRSPQFQLFERMTRVNVAREMIEYLKKKKKERQKNNQGDNGRN